MMSEIMVSRSNPLARAANGMNNAAAAMLELQKSQRSNAADKPEPSDLASRRSAEKPPVDAVSISDAAKKKQSEDAEQVTEQVASQQAPSPTPPAPPATAAKAAEPATEPVAKPANSRPAAAAAAQYAQQQASAKTQSSATPNISETA
ncbi:hypothetical protein [Deefgea sp. CFH1-16]|uniref:hypothetical protein n=1 Tax=Deefgea sp. CFH1-16 TaxID=2675457 RepID=UPI001940239D|nr:hypothetical protein [Deefgea sp. CFH1-16]MBM5574367.1 hypothetical protein [Deefgea sp. CFH1-16]